MEELMVIQGRRIAPADISLIRQLLIDNPSWNRTHLSGILCQKWGWRQPNGQLKDMACRSLLLKLQEAGYIVLPPRRVQPTNRQRKRSPLEIPHRSQPICCSLKKLLPLQITPVPPRSDDHSLFKCLLSRYHYLGHRTVGENMKYLIRDRTYRPLACVLFGSAAWKTAPRDVFIGWDGTTRKRNLTYITNNMRFLVLPWVRVSLLASHILSQVSRRIREDWIVKYGHPIYLLETFVDRSRYQGTCYKAANWILAGQTQGRSRNDRNRTIEVPAKDVYLYPLIKNFRRELCYAHP